MTNQTTGVELCFSCCEIQVLFLATHQKWRDKTSLHVEMLNKIPATLVVNIKY